MRTFILLSAFLVISVQGYSQYRGGLEAGVNITSADFNLNGPVNTKTSWGIRLGYVGEFNFSDNLYARFALLINQRGFQFADERWGLNAIDLPLNLGYAVKLNDENLKIFIDGGFNLEYNFRAFTKVDGELVTISIGGGENDVKPVAIGVNFGTGLEISPKTKLRFSYYKGLTNLLRTDNDSWKNQVFGLAVNFFFKR